MIVLLTPLNLPSSAADYILYGLSLLLVLFLYYLTFIISKKTLVSLISLIVGLSALVSYFFAGFHILTVFLVAFYMLAINSVILLNIPSLRSFLLNIFRFKVTKKLGKKEKTAGPEVTDETLIYQPLTEAVTYLSKTKTGAIIVIERKTNLSEFIKNGTILNAPFSSELLMTIFYPGTRLHDGAVIIKNRKIVAASVYFTPSTKPLLGKYGSRHRAALGISEQTDALTIVVSEETGRISFAYAGELEPVFIDNFKDQLIRHLQQNTTTIGATE